MVRQLKLDGHKLILWTYRSEKFLDEAIEYSNKEGLEFDAINKNTNSEVFNANKISRKVVADLYIDDRNLGGLGDWRENYKKISGKELPKK